MTTLEHTHAEIGDVSGTASEPFPDDARLMHHDYDGIREYDNPLPGWWSAIFIGSIVFAICYGFYFHVANWGGTIESRYQATLAEYQEKKVLRDRAEAANVSEDVLARNSTSGDVLAAGLAVFKTRCVSCHGPEGAGLIGPNLTDLRQIHGTTRMDLYTTINGGVPGTAMLAWGEQMPQTDILAVASFVTTLRGKNIAGKEPQGQPVQPFTSP